MSGVDQDGFRGKGQCALHPTDQAKLAIRGLPALADMLPRGLSFFVRHPRCLPHELATYRQ